MIATKPKFTLSRELSDGYDNASMKALKGFLIKQGGFLMKRFTAFLFALLLLLPIAGFSADTININTADKETLMSVIKGVGETKAEAIINYREENGNFKSVDDLANVKGVGQTTIDKHREQLSISD